MKKIKLGLFPKVLIAISLGALLGLVMPDVGVRIFKTFNVLFAQLLKFIVPLLVLGLVTPAISNLGKGAGKMLLTVIVISYISTICAGFFAYGSAGWLFPKILEVGSLSTDAAAAKAYEPYINLRIPPLCDILTALCLSFMIGVCCIHIKGTALKTWFEEFGEVVKMTIEKAIIPLLPFYIFTMMCEMSASGKLAAVMGTGVKVILTGVVVSILYLILQYCIAGAIAGKNPFKCLWNMLPAYLTGFSICSSSAVIPVTLDCTRKNGVSEETANFVVPLCSTVHMCGSTIKLGVTATAVAFVTGAPLSFALFANFVLMQGIAAVAAPGVMSGVLMASVGLLESILGFSPEMTALVMTIYLALDGYGPACNVTGDGGVALIVDKWFRKA
ncbi:MAG: dicarboxylate/amino acid:cation symporter [Bacteroidales bacterium]|nr:dicarboxylate/amino acid:cation symporter [Bacteroidales bacterium]MBQ9597975.1 dicarboxylate/amino acid:cation symporter [Bacteroidales bacterium]